MAAGRQSEHPSAPRLSLEEGVLLGHALVAHVAEEAGIRCLAIKGPVLERQGLRRTHQSRDVDVWVDPAQIDEMVRCLVAVGFGEKPRVASASVLGRHSRTLSATSLGCEIDIHDRFPGFLAKPQKVFDALWHNHRDELTLAGTTVSCTSRVASTAVLALHLLRTPGRQTGALAELQRTADGLLEPAEVDALVALTRSLNAASTLAPFLEAVHPRHTVSDANAVDQSERQAWRLWTESADNTAVAWVYLLSQRPFNQWPSTLWRALIPTQEAMRLRSPESHGRAEIWWARVQRISGALSRLPSAILRVWRSHQMLRR